MYLVLHLNLIRRMFIFFDILLFFTNIVYKKFIHDAEIGCWILISFHSTSKHAVICRDILSVLCTNSENNSERSSELHFSIYLKHFRRLLVSSIRLENWKMDVNGQAVKYNTRYKGTT